MRSKPFLWPFWVLERDGAGEEEMGKACKSREKEGAPMMSS